MQLYAGIKTKLSGLRKAMRLTRFIGHFRLAALTSEANTAGEVMTYLAISTQLGHAFCMLFDNFTYLNDAGVRPSESAARLQDEAHRAWLFALVCSMSASLYTLFMSQAAEQKQGAKEENAQDSIEQMLAK